MRRVTRNVAIVVVAVLVLLLALGALPSLLGTGDPHHIEATAVSASDTQYPDAIRNETAYVRQDNTTYRLTVIQP